MESLIPQNFESQTFIIVAKIVFYNLTAIVAILTTGAVLVAEIFKGRILSLFNKDKSQGEK